MDKLREALVAKGLSEDDLTEIINHGIINKLTEGTHTLVPSETLAVLKQKVADFQTSITCIKPIYGVAKRVGLIALFTNIIEKVKIKENDYRLKGKAIKSQKDLIDGKMMFSFVKNIGKILMSLYENDNLLSDFEGFEEKQFEESAKILEKYLEISKA